MRHTRQIMKMHSPDEPIDPHSFIGWVDQVYYTFDRTKEDLAPLYKRVQDLMAEIQPFGYKVIEDDELAAFVNWVSGKSGWEGGLVADDAGEGQWLIHWRQATIFER